MRDTLQERTLGLQYVGAIMIVFGGIALVLAVVGVYGADGVHGDAAHARDRRADGARRHPRATCSGSPSVRPRR